MRIKITMIDVSYDTFIQLTTISVCCRLQGTSIPEAAGNTERTEHRQLTRKVVQDRSSPIY